MLYVFARLIEQLASVHLNQNTNHRPDITFLIPLAAVQNHLWGSVLSCVYDGVVLLIVVCGTAEVNYLYGVIQRPQPNFLLEPVLSPPQLSI